MAYCHDKAVPHSEFLSRWSPEDRAKVFAYSAERSCFCQMCGTAPWQWAENRFAFEATREVCYGCQQKDVLRDDDAKMPPGASVVLISQAEGQRRRYAELERIRLREERS